MNSILAWFLLLHLFSYIEILITEIGDNPLLAPLLLSGLLYLFIDFLVNFLHLLATITILALKFAWLAALYGFILYIIWSGPYSAVVNVALYPVWFSLDHPVWAGILGGILVALICIRRANKCSTKSDFFPGLLSRAYFSDSNAAETPEETADEFIGFDE